MIHTLAKVDPGAEIDPTAHIGPFVCIGDRVKIGAGTVVLPFSVLGGPPESKAHFFNYKFGVQIGSNCVIGNHCTVDSGSERDTIIGDDCWMLARSHVGHDARLQNHVNLACGVDIGGHAFIMAYANFGLKASIHQNCIAGPLSMIGMHSCVTKSHAIDPFGIYVGSPAKFLKRNEVGIERSGLSALELRQLEKDYWEIVPTSPGRPG